MGRAKEVATQALWLALVLSALAVGLVMSGASLFTGLIGLEGEAADHAVRYLRIAALGLPAVLVSIAAQGVLRGVGDYRRPLWALAFGNVLNIAIELPLVFSFGLSVTGSAASTVISQWAVVLLFIPMLRPLVHRAGHRRPHRAAMRDLLVIGRNLALRVFSMLTILTGAAVLAARSGVKDLAAHQIVAGAFMLLALVLDALAVPAHTLIGQAVGAGARVDARRIASRVMALSLIVGVALASLVYAVSRPLARLFTVDEAVADAAGAGLAMLAIVLLPGAIAFAGDGILIGAGDHRFLGLAALVHTLLMAPIVVAPGVADGIRVSVIWALLGVWMLLRAITVAVRYRLVLRPEPTYR